MSWPRRRWERKAEAVSHPAGRGPAIRPGVSRVDSPAPRANSGRRRPPGVPGPPRLSNHQGKALSEIKPQWEVEEQAVERSREGSGMVEVKKGARSRNGSGKARGRQWKGQGKAVGGQGKGTCLTKVCSRAMPVPIIPKDGGPGRHRRDRGQPHPLWLIGEGRQQGLRLLRPRHLEAVKRH